MISRKKVARHYVNRLIVLGPKKATKRAVQKIEENIRNWHWKYKAYQGTAPHSWQAIIQKHAYQKNCKQFLDILNQQHLSFVRTLYKEVSEKEIINQAELFANNSFDLLGSGQQHFVTMPWHEDFRLRAQNQYADCSFSAHIFCKDRAISVGTTKTLVKDIKIPWELSRFYQLWVLGKAFSLTNNKKYCDVALNQTISWLDENPYLFGVNWMCPMEVGLRSVNWIIGFEFFKHMMPFSFAERFICSLYDHLIYLENNWEIYDGRTSNHYLSDLIGYFYVCWFFKDLPVFDAKREWCYQEFLKEWDKQVFDDGTAYEGSTAYHRLVTEIFYHFYLLCNEFGLTLDRAYQAKLKRMVEFIDWCTVGNGALVTIGDNDSGRVLWYGLPRSIHKYDDPFVVTTSPELRTKGKLPLTPFVVSSSNHANVPTLRQAQGERGGYQGIKCYRDFGLSIIKNEEWHVTLRHHAYRSHQPNGHHHVDIGSITLAINNIPLFVDPGSYVYTPSALWRNYFRSAAAHNCFFLMQQEPIALDNQLFMLTIPVHQPTEEDHVQCDQNTIAMHHNLYKSYGLQAARTIQLLPEIKQLCIYDRWNSANAQLIDTTWHFTLGPDITIENDGAQVICSYNKKPIATIQSELKFEIIERWVSLEYGSKIPTKGLQARKQLKSSQEVMIVITKME